VPRLATTHAPSTEPISPADSLSRSEARRLTDRFKREASSLWRKLVQLHDGSAHTTLGYRSWHAYCEAEFGLGRTQSYRLLDAGRVAEVVPQLGNEAQARALWPLLRDRGPAAVVALEQEVRERAGEAGVTAAQLQQAVAEQIAPTLPADPDRVPGRPTRARSQAGKLYQLGPHRLICGDSTDAAVLAELFENEQAAMIWTDPPYGVDYIGKTADALTIQNDGAAGLRQLLVDAWHAALPHLVESAPFYIAGPTGPTAADFYASFEQAGLDFHQQLVWRKPHLVLGHCNYQMQHEGIYHGHGPGRTAGRATPDRYRWYGPDNATSVLDIPSPSASREHPTMKPVELIIPMLQNSSLPNEIVLDQFAGSGSTLAAAHHTGRRAYLVELDPAYCDVIRKRWHTLSRNAADPD